MTYYKVKPEFDQFKVISNHKVLITLFENELFTESEFNRYKIPMKCVSIESISRKNTGVIFGKRVEL